MAKRVDSNQKSLFSLWRKLGATVQDLSKVGKGCPDCIVGFRDVNYLVEIKDGSRYPSERRLTEDEFKWHRHWAGQVCVIENTDQARELLL